MNYEKTYHNLISKAKSLPRKKGDGSYYELHHIVPRCMGGTDDKHNLVLLTGREHFVAHKLLHFANPHNNLLFHAYYAMCNQSEGREYSPSSRDYEYTRSLFSKQRSLAWSGENNPSYGRDQSGNKNPMYGKDAWNKGLESDRKGKTYSEIYGDNAEVIAQKISSALQGIENKNRGKTNVEMYGAEKALEISQKISAVQKNRKRTPEQRLANSLARLGVAKIKVKCDICGLEVSQQNYSRHYSKHERLL